MSVLRYVRIPERQGQWCHTLHLQTVLAVSTIDARPTVGKQIISPKAPILEACPGSLELTTMMDVAAADKLPNLQNAAIRQCGQRSAAKLTPRRESPSHSNHRNKRTQLQQAPTSKSINTKRPHSAPPKDASTQYILTRKCKLRSSK